VWGTRDNGHVLPLALGIPFEAMTVCILHHSVELLFHTLWQAVTHLTLAGILDRHPNLCLLIGVIAHLGPGCISTAIILSHLVHRT
jgi:aminocarboxymuconate-semialdehyde decarboxylase